MNQSTHGTDPAFLFYSSDFLTGTMFMTNEQVGKYIRLMCAQHQKGHLPEKDMMKICGTYDEDVFGKFTKDEQGLYYNSRLEKETTKRKAFCESRRNNRLKKSDTSKTYDGTYVPHMENENEIIDSILSTIPKVEKAKKEKEFTPPTVAEMVQYFDEKGFTEDFAKYVHEYYSTNKWRDSENRPVKAWKQKCLSVWLTPRNNEYKKSAQSATVRRMVL